MLILLILASSICTSPGMEISIKTTRISEAIIAYLPTLYSNIVQYFRQLHDYTFMGITLSMFSAPSPTFSTDFVSMPIPKNNAFYIESPTIVSWAISFNYQYNLIIGFSGSGSINLKNFKISAETTLDGKLTGIKLKFYGLGAEISESSMSFNGDILLSFASFIFNNFNSALELGIKMYGASLLNLVMTQVNLIDLHYVFTSYKLGFNMNLIKSPVVSSTNTTLDLYAIFELPNGDLPSLPDLAKIEIGDTYNNYDVVIGINEQPIVSLLEVLAYNKFFYFNCNNATVNNATHLYFTTSDFYYYFPNLNSVYGNLPMSMNCVFTNPLSLFSKTLITFNGIFECKFSVINQKKETLAFQLNTNITAGMMLTLSHTSLSVQIKSLNINSMVASQNTFSLDTKTLLSDINNAMVYASRYINLYQLVTLIEIPDITNIKLVNTRLDFYKGYAVLATDFQSSSTY